MIINSEEETERVIYIVNGVDQRNQIHETEGATHQTGIEFYLIMRSSITAKIPKKKKEEIVLEGKKERNFLGWLKEEQREWKQEAEEGNWFCVVFEQGKDKGDFLVYAYLLHPQLF